MPVSLIIDCMSSPVREDWDAAGLVLADYIVRYGVGGVHRGCVHDRNGWLNYVTLI